MVLFFSVRGEEKYEINYKKKKNFSPFRSFFIIFGRSFAPKGDVKNFKKKEFSAFFRYYG